MRLLRVLLSAALLLSCSVPVWCQGPTLLFHDSNTAVTTRKYPSCAVNVHSIGQNSASPAMMVFGGYDANSNVLATYDLTTTGQWDYGFLQAAKPTFNWAYQNYTGTSCNVSTATAPPQHTITALTQALPQLDHPRC